MSASSSADIFKYRKPSPGDRRRYIAGYHEPYVGSPSLYENDIFEPERDPWSSDDDNVPGSEMVSIVQT